MNLSYDSEALWLKAKLFLNRALDEGPDQSFDEQALWASLALELLGKSTLSRVSPALIADPSESGNNLLVAAGLVESSGPVTSVRASTIWSRCQRAFKPFDERRAKKIADARNEYLHGGALGFLTSPPNTWWPEFWSLVNPLVTAQDRTLEELLGEERAEEARRHLERNTQNIEHSVTALMEAARRGLDRFSRGELSSTELRIWKARKPRLAYEYSYEGDAPCPVCSAEGRVWGEEVDDVRIEVEEILGAPDSETLDYCIGTVWTEAFWCSTCHLMIEGAQYIDVAGIDQSFEVLDENLRELQESEYGND